MFFFLLVVRAIALHSLLLNTALEAQEIFDWNSFKALVKGEGALEFPQDRIIIKGFAYPDEDGKWMISPEPNLKSCCLHKQPAILYLEANTLPLTSGRAVALGGLLSEEPLLNGSKVFILKELSIEEGEMILKGGPLLALLFAMALLLGFLLYRRFYRLPI